MHCRAHYRRVPLTIDVPRVDHVSRNRDALEGEEVTLECHASGVPPPQYTWFDPQRRNLSEVGGYYVDRERGVLTITKVRRYEDNGKFTCLAENAAGRHELEHDVQVITRPVVTSFENVTFVRGANARFECRATGHPLPQLFIRKDGESQVLFEGRNRVVLRTYTSYEEAVLELTLQNIQRTDDGLYYCAAENKAGRVDRVGHLTVEFAPDLSSTNQRVKTWDGNAVNLSCVAEAIPNATVRWWQGSRELYNDGTFTLLPTHEGSNLLVRPQGTPGIGGGNVYGNYRCEATNIHGTSYLDIRLEQAHTPDPPGPIHKLHDTPTTITLDIGYPVNDGGLPVRKYVVYYREDGLNEDRNVNFTIATGGPYKLEHLTPRYTYYIRIAAVNDVGMGPFTQELRYQMPFGNRISISIPSFSLSHSPISHSPPIIAESAPEPVPITINQPNVDPESGLLESSSPHDYLLQWREPVNNGREILMYKLKYYRVSVPEHLCAPRLIMIVVLTARLLFYMLIASFVPANERK